MIQRRTAQILLLFAILLPLLLSCRKSEKTFRNAARSIKLFQTLPVGSRAPLCEGSAKGSGGLGDIWEKVKAIPNCKLKLMKSLRTPAQNGTARLEVLEDIPIIHLYGTREEMAAQYGTLLKEALQALHGYVNALLPREEIERLAARAKNLEKNLPPEMLGELKTIAAAAGIPYEEILTLNVTPSLACSTLAVWGKNSEAGKLILGRNAEYSGFGLSDCGSLVVVYHPKEGKKLLSINFIGMIGSFTGINEDGVAYGNMLVFNSSGPAPDPAGLPIQLLLRQAAHGSANAKEFSEKLLAAKHLIPMNVMVADSKKALVLELGGTGSVVREAASGKDCIAESNYFLSPQQKARPVACPRYKSLMEAAEKREGKFGVEEMKKALAGAIIEGVNLQAAVFVPADMKAFVSVNKIPAAAGPYQELDAKKLMAASTLTQNKQESKE